MSNRHRRVNSEMLTLARESRGLTQPELAKRLEVSQGWLSRVEAGLRGIQKEQLDKLSDILGYPSEFFLQKDKVYGLGITSLYHRKLQSVGTRNLRRIHAQVYLRTLAIEKLLKGVDIGDVQIRPIDLEDYDGDAKEVARFVRAGWQLPSGPIQNLVSVIEDSRGIVIPFDFNTSKIDAISHWPPKTPPLFFVNMYNPTDRLRFTLCHELGHVIMHQYPIDRTFIEHQANVFAAEFLMPEKDIRPQLIDLDLEKLMVLKQYWRVSMAALLKRASDLEVITPRKARYFWMLMGKAGYRVREPIELDIPPEIPSLYSEIINTYIDELDYSVEELSKYICWNEKEVRLTFIDAEKQRQKHANKEAIKAIEKFLKEQHLN